MKLFDFDFFLQSLPQILARLPITFLIAAVSFLGALLLGFIIAVIKLYKVPVLRWFANLYISFIRGTPVLVQLYIICYGIPKVIYYPSGLCHCPSQLREYDDQYSKRYFKETGNCYFGWRAWY